MRGYYSEGLSPELREKPVTGRVAEKYFYMVSTQQYICYNR